MAQEKKYHTKELGFLIHIKNTLTPFSLAW